jgi:hypothetical protein
MKLDGRVLALTNPVLTGADVDRLHEELSQLGDPYRQLVAHDVDPEGRRQFGEGTRKAVTTFQERNRQRLQDVVAASLDGTEDVRWSGVWGTVDPATAQLINELVADVTQQFVVRGRVEYEDGKPTEGIRVVVFDRDLGDFKQELGGSGTASPTNAGGVFPEVQYTARAYARGEGRQGASADLVFELAPANRDQAIEMVAVYRQRGLPGRSEEALVSDPVTGIRAQPVETVRLVIRRKGDALPSEYERLMSALDPLLAGRTSPDRFDETRHRDLTFAARETGEDRVLIETVSQAWILAKGTGLAPELFYGLLRHEPPTVVQPMSPDLPGLLAFGRKSWDAKLTEAFELRLIPASMQAEKSRWLEQLQGLLAQNALQTRATPDRIALGDLLTFSRVGSDRHLAFAALLTQHEGVADDLWKKVADQLKWTLEEIRSVRDAIELSDVVSSYQPLLSRLFEMEKPPRARALASWDRQKLEDLVGIVGTPSDDPDATATERRTKYIDGVESRLRESYPAAYVAKALRGIDDDGVRKAGDWLHGMLSQTTALPEGVPAFDLTTTPATGYLREHGDRLFARANEAERTHLSSQLKRVQRVYQLSATPEQMPRLFDEQLESAHQIVRWSHEHFVQQYGERLGGADAAAAVHSKARYIHGTLLNLYLDFRKIYPAQQPGFETPPAMHTLDTSVPTPTLNKLFGNDDLCACASCLSVLSPAAYFVDLLQFVDVPLPLPPPGSPAPPLGTPKTIQEVLLRKRPDLAHIQLTCDNTNTRIPYVDLVNEILASYVAHDVPFAYTDPKNGVVGRPGGDHRLREARRGCLSVQPSLSPLAGGYAPLSCAFRRRTRIVDAAFSGRWRSGYGDGDCRRDAATLAAGIRSGDRRALRRVRIHSGADAGVSLWFRRNSVARHCPGESCVAGVCRWRPAHGVSQGHAELPQEYLDLTRAHARAPNRDQSHRRFQQRSCREADSGRRKCFSHRSWPARRGRHGLRVLGGTRRRRSFAALGADVARPNVPAPDGYLVRRPRLVDHVEIVQPGF